ncbi:HAD-like protein [Chytriomyces cf. hyalinus JEL632]|nr:HAD-like protein [Chytriomyces cf. hyalinus JEL632]
MIKCVIFDIGGVVVSSPLEAIREYEREKGLPANYLNVAIQARGQLGAFQRFERGEITLDEFAPLFTAELNDAANNGAAYARFVSKKGSTLAPVSLHSSPFLDGLELLHRILSTSVDMRMVDAIRRLKSSGRFKLAALTNNFAIPKDAQTPAEKNTADLLMGLFDAFFESSVVGLRKPDPRFYLHACESLGVLPNECVFLDDIGPNLKSAQDLGFHTIRVIVGHVPNAIAKLEQLTGVSLSNPAKL